MWIAMALVGLILGSLVIGGMLLRRRTPIRINPLVVGKNVGKWIATFGRRIGKEGARTVRLSARFLWRHKKLSLTLASIASAVFLYQFWHLMFPVMGNEGGVASVVETTKRPLFVNIAIGLGIFIAAIFLLTLTVVIIIVLWKNRSAMKGLGKVVGATPIPGVSFWSFVWRLLLRAFVIFVVLFAGYMLMTTVFTSVWHDTILPWVNEFKQNRPTEYWISALVIGAFLLFLALPSKKLEGDEKKKRDELREKLILWPFGLVKLCLVMFVVVAIPSLFISDALRDNRSPSQHKAEIAAGVNSRARVTHETGPRRVTAKMEGVAEKGRWTKSYSLGKYSMVVQDAPILVMPNNNESEAFLAIPGIVSGPGVGKLLKAAFRVPEDSPHDTVRFVIEYYE